ncbi:MAG: nuclear transport factor 2 family protein [Longimicrobiales bacterium]
MHHDALSATLAALLCLFVTACTVPDPEAAAQRGAVNAALDSVYATFSEAYAQANITLLMDGVYARDAYYLPPGSPILHGQDQFRGQFSFLERYTRDGGAGPEIAFEIVDREISGGMAYDVGVYTLRAPDASPEAEGSRGKFIVIWKRNSRGEWRIHADGFSAIDVPASRPVGDGQ